MKSGQICTRPNTSWAYPQSHLLPTLCCPASACQLATILLKLSPPVIPKELQALVLSPACLVTLGLPLVLLWVRNFSLPSLSAFSLGCGLQGQGCIVSNHMACIRFENLLEKGRTREEILLVLYSSWAQGRQTVAWLLFLPLVQAQQCRNKSVLSKQDGFGCFVFLAKVGHLCRP